MLKREGGAAKGVGVVTDCICHRYAACLAVASPRTDAYEHGMSEQSASQPTIRIERAEGDAASAEPLDLGARVRELRKAQDWTLEQAASRAGLARSTLSKIENGQMSPTYEALKKLAIGLEISVPQLFTPPSRDQVNARMATTLAGEGGELITTTYEHNILAEPLSSKKMLPYRTRVRARTMEDFGGWIRHDGEEFMYVLTGRVTLFTEFYEPVTLGRGDSVYYDASMGHNVVSVSADDATILWVTSLV